MHNVIFIRSYDGVPELAARIARIVDGRVTHGDAGSEIRGPAGALLPGIGQTHAAVVRPDPLWPFYPPGEFRATDAYNVELRLRPSEPADPNVDHDVALAVFGLLCAQQQTPMLLCHGQRLLATYQPELGRHDFADDVVTILPDHADRWGPWVLTSPATSRGRKPSAGWSRRG